MSKGIKRPAIPWPDELDLHLTGIAQGGDGVGRWEGRPVFAAGGLPGEDVRVRLRDRHASFARGDVVAVTTAAPERIVSPCPFEAACGAAGWGWSAYPAQLSFKAAILQDQLQHLGGISIEVDTVHGMQDASGPVGRIGPADPAWHYRTTAELHVAGNRIGPFRTGSHDIADLPGCCLHHPLIDDALPTLRTLLTPDLGL